MSPTKTCCTVTDHQTIGQYFMGHGKEMVGEPAVYFCYAWSHAGFWLVDISDVTNVKCVSERAIGRTFHSAYARDNGSWFCPQWATIKEKVPNQLDACVHLLQSFVDGKTINTEFPTRPAATTAALSMLRGALRDYGRLVHICFYVTPLVRLDGDSETATPIAPTPSSWPTGSKPSPEESSTR